MKNGFSMLDEADASSGVKYALETNVHDDGKIESTLRDSMFGEISRWLVNTQEQQTKDALIALGWTPPPEEARQGES